MRHRPKGSLKMWAFLRETRLLCRTSPQSGLRPITRPRGPSGNSLLRPLPEYANIAVDMHASSDCPIFQRDFARHCKAPGLLVSAVTVPGATVPPDSWAGVVAR